MSVKMMALVWENFTRGGSEKLALLALADWCNDEGGSLHPSIGGVAKKISLSEKATRRIVHGFIDDGYLEVIGNPHGGAPTQTRHYRLNVKKLSTPPAEGSRTPPAHDTPPVEGTPPVDGHLPLPCTGITPPVDGSRTTKNQIQNRQLKTKPSAANEKISLSADGVWQHIADELLSLWKRAYPALSLEAELAAASAWIVANPMNKKSNYARFLTNWLKRAQDHAPRVKGALKPTKTLEQLIAEDPKYAGWFEGESDATH